MTQNTGGWRGGGEQNMNMAERECKTIKELEKAIYSKIRNAPSPSPPLPICLHLSLSPSLPTPRHFP